MPKERRMYSRVILNIDTTIYLSDGSEIICNIYDISENGICLKINQDIESLNIQKGDLLSFQTVDKFVLYDEEVSEFITGKAKILRIQQQDKKLTLGCKFTNIPKALSKYIQDKKIAIFITNGFHI